MMQSMLAFLGRTHPLWVHLPIGFLIMGGLFYFLSQRDRFAAFHTAAMVALWLGTAASAFSALTGYLLSLHGSYDDELIGRHQNAALLTTALALGWCYVVNSNMAKSVQYSVAALTLIGVAVTGHFGGSLTHGEGYLTGETPEAGAAVVYRKPLQDIGEAMVYAQVIDPILKEKCVACHGPAKQKGGLRLDTREFILKGGEDGSIFNSGDPASGEMVRRINLPPSAKAHMPPRNHPPLLEGDAELLQWWVRGGAPFDKRVRELPADEAILDKLKRFGAGGVTTEANAETPQLPSYNVPAAAPEVLSRLKEKGIMAVPMAINSPFLKVSCYAVDTLDPSVMEALQSVKEQAVELNLAKFSVSDSMLRVISGMTNLMRLHLENTTVTDKGLIYLKGLNHLVYLNLSNTSVTFEGVKQLTGLIGLRQLYLNNTRVGTGDWPAIRAALPAVQVDSGSYRLEYRASDTQLVRPKP